MKQLRGIQPSSEDTSASTVTPHHQTPQSGHERKTMTAPIHTPALAIATVFAIAAIAPPALPAAAEPKNDVPFVTATLADRSSPDAKDTAQRAGLRDLMPWERWQATQASRGVRASATKNAVIVVHATPVSPIVVSGGNSFDWKDAGIGAAGGLGIALLLAGSFVLTRRGRQGERLVMPA